MKTLRIKRGTRNPLNCWVKHLRYRHGRTRIQDSNDMGVGYSSITDYEFGKAVASDKYINGIVRIYKLHGHEEIQFKTLVKMAPYKADRMDLFFEQFTEEQLDDILNAVRQTVQEIVSPLPDVDIPEHNGVWSSSEPVNVKYEEQ